MRRISPFLISSFLFFSAAGTLAAMPQAEQTPPDREQVTDAIERLKAEEAAAIHESARQAHVFKQIGEWLQSNAFYIRVLVISGGILVLFLVVYLLFRFVFARIFDRTVRKKERRAPTRGTRGFNTDHLRQLETAGHYAEALLYLHRMSIEQLLERKVLLARNLTNQGIIDRLRDRNMAAAFQTVARMSERVLFDRLSLSRDLYLPCRKAYTGAFGDEA